MSPLATFRAVRAAAWLGWAVEANWTDPVTFLGLVLVRPFSATLLLVLIFQVARGTGPADPAFAQLFLGGAFYSILAIGLHAVSWSIMVEREQYETLRYAAIAPVPFAAYVAGRGAASLGLGALGAGVVIVFGAVALGVPVLPLGFLSPLFLIGLVCGLTAAVGIGLGLAGIHLLTARHQVILGEAFAATCHLFAGAMFPPEQLPLAGQWIARVLPFTYWLEAMRRPLLGHPGWSPFLAEMSDGWLLAVCAATSLGAAGLGLVLFRWCEHTARRRGVLDLRRNS